MRVMATFRWLRCRRFRSRDALVGIILVIVLLFLSPAFFRIPLATSDVIVRSDTSTKVHEQRTLRPPVTVPLTGDMERLDAFVVMGTSYSSPSVDTSTCSGLNKVDRPPTELAEKSEWQRLSAGSDETFVFSAHVDTRWSPVPLIQIIGITSDAGLGSPVCRMWYADSDSAVYSRASVRVISETHSRRYAAFIISCPGRVDNSSPPFAVTLLREVCDVTTPNLLRVRPPTSASSRVNFTVCVTPFNFRYNNYQQLVEMLEVNRMFGAGHFVFYNYSTGPFITRFLESYRDEGLVTVVPWSVPVAVDVWPPDKTVFPAIHYFAQLAALNDCLYRCVGRSTLAVFTDLDEILVPRVHTNWNDMLNFASSTFHPGPSGPFPGAYVVRSSFFRTDWPSDEQVPRAAVDRHLVTILKTQRETKIYPLSSRSKYVVWTKAVKMVGVHDVMDLMPGVNKVQIDHEIGLVHHYRLWFDEEQNPPLVDRSMHRFSDEVVARVQSRYYVVDMQREPSKL